MCGRIPAPRAACESRPAPAREPLQRLVDLALVVRHDGLAVRRLVARVAQGVERERVLLGRRPLLLEQAPEHSELDGIGVHREERTPVRATPPRSPGG